MPRDWGYLGDDNNSEGDDVGMVTVEEMMSGGRMVQSKGRVAEEEWLKNRATHAGGRMERQVIMGAWGIANPLRATHIPPPTTLLWIWSDATIN